MVGQSDAKEQVAAAIHRAFEGNRRDWPELAMATIWYLSRHDGNPTIGGGPSVAECERGAFMHWPLVKIDGRIYLRGLDVTDNVPKMPDANLMHIKYNEDWHSRVDARRPQTELRENQGFIGTSKFVENWIVPDELFDCKVDPEELKAAPDLTLPPAVVVLLRPGEVPWAVAREESTI